VGLFSLIATSTRNWLGARPILSKLGFPIHEAAGRGRRSVAWSPGNPDAIAAMLRHAGHA